LEVTEETREVIVWSDAAEAAVRGDLVFRSHLFELLRQVDRLAINKKSEFFCFD
jgi:hypothetical protein